MQYTITNHEEIKNIQHLDILHWVDGLGAACSAPVHVKPHRGFIRPYIILSSGPQTTVAHMLSVHSTLTLTR